MQVKKYWVPALERANDTLQLISSKPAHYKLMDLSKQLGIHKSSMFSLLHTMEALNWVIRDIGNTYSVGSAFGAIGSAYFQQFDLINIFQTNAQATKERIGETIQLARLEKHEVLYLAKAEAASPVRLASDPGMTFPAHVTALGKVMLAQLTDAEVTRLFPKADLPILTPNTIKTRSLLMKQLAEIKRIGYAFDLQEAVMGFCCVAAPILNQDDTVMAAVSFSIPLHQWDVKQEQAIVEICRLAKALSHLR